MYPWSMLTEVGDYFAVPAEFKHFAYVSALVAQRNYRTASKVRYSATKTSYGTIVMVAQVGEEKPPFEYLSPEGIMSVTSRAAIRAQGPHTALGERATVAKRTVSQIVGQMSVEQKEANLPWWYDKKGQLVFNSKVATPADLERWYNKEKMPGKDEPYPAYYDLDENLTKRERSGDDEADEAEFFEVLEDGNATPLTDGDAEKHGYDND
jgi:hypothetical protein